MSGGDGASGGTAAVGSPRFRQREDLCRRELDDLVVLGTLGCRVVTLEGTAVDMWTALASPITVAELVDDLSRRYGTPADTIRPAVVDAVERLLDDGVVIGEPHPEVMNAEG